MVVVPLLATDPTRHVLDLACRLAADRGSRVLLLAPLYVDWELPLDAHFHTEEAELRIELGRERALAESYGVSACGQIVRTRPSPNGSVAMRKLGIATTRRASAGVVRPV